MRFTKMEGTGNDYIYINGFEEHVEDPAALSVRMSLSHFACGSDGLILILPSDVADFRMRMFNSDGSESGMCGNGIRCVAKYCYDRGLTDKTEFTVESGGQIKRLACHLKDGKVDSVRVDMGEPVLEGREIPSMLSGNPVVGHPLTAQGETFPVTLVNMGNPHAVIFVPDVAAVALRTVGPLLEHDPIFPQRANIEFAEIKDRGHVTVRVWERGTGETLACGTGASATLVACVLNGLTDRAADIVLPGGTLRIEWNQQDNHVYMTGPATFVYDGQWLQA